MGHDPEQPRNGLGRDGGEGGGSGGALRLHAPVVDLAASAGRLDVSGGAGGVGVWNDSLGGAGSVGLVRIEDSAGATDHAALAASIEPFDPTDVLYGQDSVGFLSAAPGAYGAQRSRPGSFSASVSCWIRPAGSFYELDFVEDSTTSSAAQDQGWNMDVIWQPAGQQQVLVPFRGDNPLFANSFEVEFGNLLNHGQPPGMGSPVAVRFQGARTLAPPADPCDVDLDAFDLVFGSLTPWVEHPAELNEFQPRPNMVRFTVVFDGAVDPQLVDAVKGVTNLAIRAKPD